MPSHMCVPLPPDETRAATAGRDACVAVGRDARRCCWTSRTPPQPPSEEPCAPLPYGHAQPHVRPTAAGRDACVAAGRDARHRNRHRTSRARRRTSLIIVMFWGRDICKERERLVDVDHLVRPVRRSLLVHHIRGIFPQVGRSIHVKQPNALKKCGRKQPRSQKTPRGATPGAGAGPTHGWALAHGRGRPCPWDLLWRPPSLIRTLST